MYFFFILFFVILIEMENGNIVEGKFVNYWGSEEYFFCEVKDNIVDNLF